MSVKPDNGTASNPIEDLRRGIEIIKNQCGVLRLVVAPTPHGAISTWGWCRKRRGHEGKHTG
jgi:hypothetical protein